MSKLFAWLAVVSAATALWISAVYGPYDPTFKRQFIYPVSNFTNICNVLKSVKIVLLFYQISKISAVVLQGLVN